MAVSSQYKRWFFLSLVLAGLLLALQLIHNARPQGIVPITRLENLLYDIRFSVLLAKPEAPSPIVIVDIDETSIQQEGRWPWDRKKVATLVQNLEQYGAGLIGLDIIFSEPSPNAVRQLLDDAQLPKALQHWLTPIIARFDSDQTLAEAVAGSTVLGYFLQNDGSSTGELPFPFYQLNEDEQARSSVLAMQHYTGSVPVLAESALGQGFVVAVPDVDGVVRRAPLVMRYQDGVYASLSLTLAQLALGAPWLKLKLVDNGQTYVATRLDIGQDIHIPLSKDGSVLVPFRGYAGSFSTLSATKIVQQQLSPAEQAQLEGAIVLVGTSALGLADLRTIPLQTSYPGVEVHANTLDAILRTAQGDNVFYRQPDWTPAAEFLLLAALGLLLALVLPGRSPSWMLSWSVVILLAILGCNGALWYYLHWDLPLSFSLFMVLLLSLFNLAVGFIETNRNKHMIQSLFSEYVPPAYVEQMLNQPERATMKGEQREMTVLFADVVGFTSSSEKLSTAELKHWLNHYLTAITQVIFSHQGTIDKYVGDMVMAFWNAPLTDAQHAQNAVLTALAMQAKVRELAPEFIQQNLPPVAIGIGLNTGPMNVGDMGSSYRRAYTVLGDAVNLGSRLEGLTRFYGVGILVSESTMSQCPDIEFWPIDRIRVKGKNEPVDVFEPLGFKHQIANDEQVFLAKYQQALAAYRAGSFNEAQAVFAELEQAHPAKKKLYHCYLERLAELGEQAPEGWQAVYTHTNK